MSLFIIGLCFLGTITAFLMRIFGYVILTGWTSLIITMLFLCASTLFVLGILGLYIGKIFQEIKQRPVFLVDEKINFPVFAEASPSKYNNQIFIEKENQIKEKPL